MVMATALLLILVACIPAAAAFLPPGRTLNGAAPVATEELHAKRRPPFATTRDDAQLKSTATSAAEGTAESTYMYDGYDKPIVLLGLSSSPANNELQRLAGSLSRALVGDDGDRLARTVETLEMSLAGGLLEEADDDDDDAAGPAGISLSVVGLDQDVPSLSAGGLHDDRAPFVVDADLISGLIRERTLTLTTGVIVLDFNHAAFTSSGKYNAKKHEADLIEAMGLVAKHLYEREGLLSVYVNVRSDEMDDDLRTRKQAIENHVLIPFTDYEICVRAEGALGADGLPASNWTDVEWELQRVVGRALLPPPAVGGTGPHSADLTMGRHTFFLSLSFPDVEDAAPHVERMCQDVDAMELRVDLLEAAQDYPEGDSRFDVLYQQQRLRALCRPHARRAPALPFAGAAVLEDALPVVYTVRTAHQAGTWPDDERGIQRMFDLLELGLRGAAEVLDVESAWDAGTTDRLLATAAARYTSLILGSHHVVGEDTSPDEAVRLYRQCRMDGRAHGAKVVLSMNSDGGDDGDQLAHRAGLVASKLDTPTIPHIGLVLGEEASWSRILNPRFTPVTHETLPAKAAPGQLTAAEIMAARLLSREITSERYCILGHNIDYSVSPQMHGEAFAAVKLPHAYARADCETVKEFVEGPLWNDNDFGGCSVTIPHKQNIMPHVDLLTDAAKEIGSVNTVIVKKDKFGTRVLIGDNTDWKGIYNPLSRRMGDAGSTESKGFALILGGGGTARAAAYAAARLGLERIYHNRTPQKAADLAEEFGGAVASSLENDDAESSLGSILARSGGRIAVIISTLPAAAEFTLPEWTLSPETASPLPVVLDVNYKPYNTALLLQATERGCDVVRGSEMLWEQGVGQFELWTGRTAPYGVMRKVVLDNCLPSAEE